MSFNKFGLSPEVVRGAQAMGFVEPTPIQLRAFPIVLAGKDLIGTAQTGTGKTAAFALPILTLLGRRAAGELGKRDESAGWSSALKQRLQRVVGSRKGESPGRAMRGSELAQATSPVSLVLEPTRELAAQVETAFRDYGRFTNLRVGLVHGGVGYGKQREALRRGVDILVATPGRLLDLLEQRALTLQSVKILVLDEVDRMLDMGFLPDVRRIVQKIPADRQTLLFSATLPPEIERLAAWVLREPELVEIGARRSPAETVTHAVYPVAAEQKFDLLMALLERTNFDSVLIFCRTKQNADRVAHFLKHAKHAVAVLHSNRTQRERIEALEGFKSGKYEVMVATDIASRGLDIAGVSHVINYDVPEHPEDYVHRIGRTGRAQSVGDAFTLLSGQELPALQAIEHFIGQKIPRLKLENFPYLYTALFESDSSVAGRRAITGRRTHRGYSFGRRR
ncbi:MAG: DEAD/DEAH box helicase [Chthoniobacterales bacterium]|nr:DEAD/DEAH box helicase [Chthoniobacterales bacterium]